jgi:hypothetical protein
LPRVDAEHDFYFFLGWIYLDSVGFTQLCSADFVLRGREERQSAPHRRPAAIVTFRNNS